MAPAKSAVDFDKIINADRERRKNESLAAEIFGKGRRQSAGPGLNNRKPGTGPSLASRVGVTKRSVSTAFKPRGGKLATGNVDAEWTHDLHTLNNPAASRVSNLPHHAPRTTRIAAQNGRLFAALHGSASSPNLSSQFNIVSSSNNGDGISIRGIAGPSRIMAQNFAPGTTAADIESAMSPIGGIILSCRIVAARPTVIAEIVVESKEGADNIVATFNNQTADGRLLHVFIKHGDVSLPRGVTRQPVASVASPAPRATTPLGPRAGVLSDRPEPQSDSRYASDRDRYAPSRDRSRERTRTQAREEVVDGSYGFDDRMDTDDLDDNRYDNRGRGRGLYSDNIPRGRNNNRGGRGRGDSRDRGRGGDRNRGYR